MTPQRLVTEMVCYWLYGFPNSFGVIPFQDWGKKRLGSSSHWLINHFLRGKKPLFVTLFAYPIRLLTIHSLHSLHSHGCYLLLLLLLLSYKRALTSNHPQFHQKWVEQTLLGLYNYLRVILHHPSHLGGSYQFR